MISFPWNESILSIQAFANDVFAYLAYLKYICLQKQTVSFSTWTNLKKIKRRFLSNNQYVRFFKRRMWRFLISCFMFTSLYWNFIIVSENNLQWNHLPAFSRSRSPKRHWKKQKLRILDEVFRMLFFGVLKRRGFLLWENKKMWSQ